MIITIDKTYKCTWPNGEFRFVLVTDLSIEIAHVIWNEPLEDDFHPTCIGMEEEVPCQWLSPAVKIL